MKSLNPQLTISFLLLILVACDPQTESMQIKNESQEVVIDLYADRMSPLDGWMTTLEVTAFDREPRKLTTEIYVEHLNPEYVKMEWTSSHAGILTFLERDDALRKFKVVVNQDLTHVYELLEKLN